MSVGQSFNLEDPSKQEQIRRGSHEYVREIGKHGAYRTKPYIHESYPKVMDRTPAPQRAAFKEENEFERARREWETNQTESIVGDKAQEEAWLAKHREPEAVENKTKKGKAA